MAEELGSELVKGGYDLVYGGSRVGLMGRLADTVLRQGGRAIGVMPKGLFRGEIVHTELTELHEVMNMHERKGKMGELADAFIALPGGFGTFEEIFEVVSWGAIGLHRKPIGLLNVDGYYNPIMNMVDQGVQAGFIHPSHAPLLICESNPAVLLEKLNSYQPAAGVNKWSELEE
jgi:uncharacterized protein (TIGR00730 family)